MAMINSINLPSPTLSLKDSQTTAVQVAIRVRPLTESEQTQPRMSQSSDSNVIKTNGNSVTIAPFQKSFHFDHVFGTESTQDQVYTNVVSNLIDRVLDGFNVTILAYGQTSSGKTHTIIGSAGLDQEGIIPRAVAALFERLHMTASSSSTQKPPSVAMDFRLPPTPSSSCITSPRSPAPPTKLRPVSNIITHHFNGNNDIPESSRRDSAPALLWMDKSPRHSVHVSFVEVYNEELVDLLTSAPVNERPPTAIREDTKGQIHWTGVKEVNVSKPNEVLRCLEIGTDARATGSTDMNAKSSRFHAIFTVTLKQEKWIPAAPSSSKSSDILPLREPPLSPVSSVSSVVGINGRPTSLKIKTRIMGQMEQQHQQQLQQHQFTPGKKEDDGEWVVVHSKLHFVDLAGSERLKRTSAEGDRRKEGININAGLLALGNVISSLASLSDTSISPVNSNNKKATHIPYRDSKLTRMLQDSLGGNAITLMIACVSPAERNLAETTNTIKYAYRARNIKNKAGRNEAEDWMTNDNPEFLRSLITQLKFDVKALKSELTYYQKHYPGSTTDLDTKAQLQQKIQDCEQGTHLLTQQHLQERAELKLDIESLLQVEIKHDQIIALLEHKLAGMTHVMVYLQRQLDLQGMYINQLCKDNQEKAHQIQTARTELQQMLHEIADLGMERAKFNLIVEWIDKVKLKQEHCDMKSSVSLDELLQPHHLRNANDLTELPMARIWEDVKDKDKIHQEINMDKDGTHKSAALGKQLIHLDQTLQQLTTERDDLYYALEHKRDELQKAQHMIERQASALTHAQQEAREAMDLSKQGCKCTEVNDTTSLVAGLEDKIQVLERARQLDQQEHDNQLDAIMDDLEESQIAYKQQSHMVVSLQQTIQNMQQRLDKTLVCPSITLPNQNQQSGDLLQDHDQQARTDNIKNVSKHIEEKVPVQPLQLRPSSSTPYPLSSASHLWSSRPAISDQQSLDSLICKSTHNDAKTTTTSEMKELQQFTDQKIQLMMKILDMETQLRTQRAQFGSETNTVTPDVMTLGGNNSGMERERMSLMISPSPRKLRSAASQPLISNIHNANPSPPMTTSSQQPGYELKARHEMLTAAAAAANDLGRISQPSGSKRASSSSSITFLSTGTQTTSSSSNHSTPQRTSSMHTTVSSVSSNDMMVSNSSSQQSTQTTADQYNKMIHALQCQAQVAESNIRAHQDVIHKLERQLSRSESSVRDTKKQLEVLHKEKQAYTLEIKNLRSQVTQIMTQQKMCLDESGERRKHLEIALEQERRLKEMAEKARLIMENRMEVLMAKRNRFMCF